MAGRAYPGDLSDQQWALIAPMIRAWKQDRMARSATGNPGSCDLREIVNAIFHQNRQTRFRLRDGGGQVTVHSVSVQISGDGVPDAADFAPPVTV
ncbi:transposase [Actinacidiphila sp. ITFR-21]|uniref:transposase n=1 Tax=Actinacidiphila sp. ITFR-21 TaxID=3075199 RepID=UPI003D80AEAC